MQFRNILWWLGFTFLAIWFQHWVSGVDVLIIGLIASLQEENRLQTFWLTLLWTLLLEGTGSLAFGSGLFWYLAAVLLYSLGRWLFEAENLLFILLLGLCLGAWHFGLVTLMSVLEDIVIDHNRLLMESVLQGLIIPPGWYLVHVLRTRLLRRMRNAHG